MSQAESGDFAADKTRALHLIGVSRETQARLERFVQLLLERQRRQNLVAKSTLPHIWTRHIADSLQLLPLAPDARVWADFGSGGGFPGIPIACALTAGGFVHLIESVGKKADFLRETVAALGLDAKVHHIRAEDFAKSCAERIDVVTARAVAPLKVLLDQAFPLIARGAIGLFPKGQDIDAELTEAAKYWTIEATKVPSITSPEGRIVVVRRLTRRKTA